MNNTLIEFVNSFADGWVTWVIAVALDSAALLVVIGLVWLAIRRSVAPQVGYGLFLLVPLKLLLPFDVVVPWRAVEWTPSTLVSSWFVRAVKQPHGSVVREGDETDNIRMAAIGAESRDLATSKPASRSELLNVDTAGLATPGRTGTDAQSQIASATPAAVPVPLARTRFSFSALALICWLTGVLWLLGRMLLTQWRFHARLKHLSAVAACGSRTRQSSDNRKWSEFWRIQLPSKVPASSLGVDLANLCRRAGVTQPVRIVEADDLTSPAVWGIVRPTIILPRAIALSLTATQLQWVLLHELAHIRRRDLLVVVIQRCAALLHFFNPAVWIANRIIDRLREYACDDLADAASDGSAADSSEAFVQILRHVNRSRQGLSGALGVFGWDSRAACILRVSRLLDSDRPIRTRPSPWGVCGLLLLAAVALPHLRAGADPAPADSANAAGNAATQDQTKSKAAEVALAVDAGEFELHVVGPDGKPIPDSRVEIRTSPVPTADQIRKGKFVKKGSYGAFLTTDAEGLLVVKVPGSLTRFDVNITTSGYGPYWAEWSSDGNNQPVPARFTAELEAGWSVGGIIVDSDGQPISGVSVHPSIKFRKRPGDTSQLGVGAVQTTDAAGKWRFDSVPASMSEVFVEINHPAYKANRRPLARSEFEITSGQEPAGQVTLNRGLTVTGKVTDETGHPIAGALVRTKFLNDIREAKTGADGIYRLNGCEPRQAKIVVSARGRATDMQEVSVDPEMAPVDFQMAPGGNIRIRVLDEQDRPIPKARIFFLRWRGRFDYFEFDHISQYADDQGVWQWNEAPLDEFKADICPPDGMQLGKQSLIARDEEYVFHPPPALVVSGNVIDAVTRKPIKAFNVVRGIRSPETSLNWVRGENYAATDGTYRVRMIHDYPAHMIRIEAAGYQARVSRDILSNEGNVTIDFALEKGRDAAATVLTPAGKPAARARVALGVAGSQIAVKNGDIDETSTYCARLDADEAGKFRFPPQDSAFQLVIMHSAGYAHVKATPESMPDTIKLEAWARVEGTFRVGKDPIAAVSITINAEGLHSYGNDVPNIYSRCFVTTGKDGRFVFERVFPGSGRVGREVVHMVTDGVIPFGSSGMMPATFEAGETTRIDLGGTGRPVVGNLQPPKNFNGMAKWQFAEIDVGPQLADPPMPDGPDIPKDIAADPAKKAVWLQKWQLTPAGKAWKAWANTSEAIERARNASPYFNASVKRDGTFRIDDMPAGKYSFSIRFDRDAPGFIDDYRFEVPPLDGARSDEPLDLGVLTLENN